jgi:hypothetical protein
MISMMEDLQTLKMFETIYKSIENVSGVTVHEIKCYQSNEAEITADWYGNLFVLAICVDKHDTKFVLINLDNDSWVYRKFRNGKLISASRSKGSISAAGTFADLLPSFAEAVNVELPRSIRHERKAVDACVFRIMRKFRGGVKV